jgi:hypothetical protein
LRQADVVLLVGHAADPHEVTKHEQWAIQHMSYAQNVLVLVHDMVCGAGNCVGGVGNCVGGVGNCFFFSLTVVGGVVFVVGFIWCVVDLVLSVLLISSFPPGLGSKGIGPRTKKMYTHCGPA